jgi:hypothetical protein
MDEDTVFIQLLLVTGLVSAAAFGGFKYGQYSERQNTPSYEEAIVSRESCQSKIDDATGRLSAAFSDNPELQEMLERQAGVTVSGEGKLLDYCQELLLLEEDYDPSDRY